MMTRTIILAVCALTGACANPNPVAPTAVNGPALGTPASMLTSRVDPNSLDTDELAGLTLEHDPFAPGVQLCRTKLRAYDYHGVTNWEIDFYTVAAPERCPAEPIE